MKRPIILALWLLLGAQAFADESIVVIANRNAPSEKINTDQAAQYFLKKQQVWPNGVQIQPVDMKEGSTLRDRFYTKVTGRGPAQMRSYWARQAFTGMSLPPKELSTEEAVLKFVATTPGAIGYVSRKNSEGDVNVILDPDR